MTIALSSRKLLILFLRLVGIHSFAVFLGLIVLPADQLLYFGLKNYSASFFQIQGGVFHLVMSGAYFMAAEYFSKTPVLIYFILWAKSIAVIFLIIYYFAMESAWIILLSAAGDAIMAALIYFLYQQAKKDRL